MDVERAAPGAVPPSMPLGFEALYRDHFDFSYRTLQHLGVPAASLPDAVQEVWLAVHQRLSRFEGRSTYRTWIFAIALNTARNHWRWQRRHGATLDLPDDLVDAAAGPERSHAGREALGLVREFLDTLDEPRRVLFISQLLEELNADETAQLLGIERHHVYHRVRDLRRAFKRWLAAREEMSQ